MPGRVVLFGASGYTGALTASALAARGVVPVLAGRSGERLRAVADRFGLDADIRVADATDERAVTRLIAPGDVLVTTVGPFSRFGRPAARVAGGAGAGYVDSTGEAAFVRWLVDELDGPARATGALLLPAFGFDFVPGQLAAALALDDAGQDAIGVRLGYFVTGGTSISTGTRVSAVGVFLDRGFAWRGGRLVGQRVAAHRRTFTAGGRPRAAISIPSAEHLFLPRTYPRLTTVEVYLGWGRQAARVAPAVSAATSAAMALPGIRPLLRASLTRLLRAPTGDPAAAARARTRSVAVAEAVDGRGRVLARVEVQGPGPYDLTADLLAEGAMRLLRREGTSPDVTGVVGPIELFGLDGTAALSATCGLVRVDT